MKDSQLLAVNQIRDLLMSSGLTEHSINYDKICDIIFNNNLEIRKSISNIDMIVVGADKVNQIITWDKKEKIRFMRIFRKVKIKMLNQN